MVFVVEVVLALICVLGTLLLLRKLARWNKANGKGSSRKKNISAEMASVCQACVSSTELLSNQSAEFSKKEVLKVTDGVYVAIGFGLANSIMIEGTDGVIIVDCMESVDTGEEVMQAFREITSKPVAAIIYTHNHSDHINGVRAFYNASRNGEGCDVYAHSQTAAIITKFMTRTGNIGFIRAARQFGQFLPDNQHINCGLGPCLSYNQDSILDLVMPTKTVDKRLDVVICGVELQLLHAPGETDDQIVVFLPQHSVLCAADNIYKAFPNLYAIRGTPSRDAYQWATSLEMMKALGATYLVPSHTRPISGHKQVSDTLSVYSDAILFVHDQTVRWMNKGYFIDDIVPLVRLPEHLRTHPYLQEFYGTVEWSVRGVFNTYIGWFGGDPAHLHALSPPENARRMQNLAGGAQQLLSAARLAIADKDSQWALLCAQSVIRANAEASDAVKLIEEAKIIAITALQLLASNETSANGRNYYLTYALELSQTVDLLPSQCQVLGAVRQVGAIEIIKMLPTRLKAQDCVDVNHHEVIYSFPDIKRAILIEIHRGVCRTVEIDFNLATISWPELRGARTDGNDEQDRDFFLLVSVSSEIFVDIAAKIQSSAGAVLSGQMTVVGRGLTSSLALKKFMDYFEDSSCRDVAPI